MRALTLLPAVLLFISCFPLNQNRLTSWEKTRLEERTADDLDGLLGDLDEISEGVKEAASEARGDWDLCINGYANCRRCYEATGTGTEGSIAMHMEGIPCTAALTIDDVRYEYTIDDRQWDGTWALRDDGWYDIAWTGFQNANLVIEGHERWDGDYDSSFTMNAGTAITDGEGNNNGWTVDYTYTGFLDRTWTVIAAKDEAGLIDGTVTSEDGIECLLSGEEYDYVLDCD